MFKLFAPFMLLMLLAAMACTPTEAELIEASSKTWTPSMAR